MQTDEKILKEQVPVGSVFQHYKGNRYQILSVGRHHEDLKLYVVYQGMYHCKEFGENPIWIRPIEMFLEEVEIDGKPMKRFTRLDH